MYVCFTIYIAYIQKHTYRNIPGTPHTSLAQPAQVSAHHKARGNISTVWNLLASPWFWSHIKQIINQAKLKTLGRYCNVFLWPKKYFRFDFIKCSHINLLEHEPFHASLLLKINAITLVSFPLSYMGNWNIAVASAALILIQLSHTKVFRLFWVLSYL